MLRDVSQCDDSERDESDALNLTIVFDVIIVMNVKWIYICSF